MLVNETDEYIDVYLETEEDIDTPFNACCYKGQCIANLETVDHLESELNSLRDKYNIAQEELNHSRKNFYDLQVMLGKACKDFDFVVEELRKHMDVSIANNGRITITEKSS